MLWYINVQHYNYKRERRVRIFKRFKLLRTKHHSVTTQVSTVKLILKTHKWAWCDCQTKPKCDYICITSSQLYDVVLLLFSPSPPEVKSKCLIFQMACRLLVSDTALSLMSFILIVSSNFKSCVCVTKCGIKQKIIKIISTVFKYLNSFFSQLSIKIRIQKNPLNFPFERFYPFWDVFVVFSHGAETSVEFPHPINSVSDLQRLRNILHQSNILSDHLASVKLWVR